MNRRYALRNISTMVAAAAMPNLKIFAAEGGKIPKQRVLRIAHITDVHLDDRNNAPKLFEQCLHHIQQLDPLPDFILNGGDAINDALMHGKSSVQRQWNLWNHILKQDCCLPVFHCIGNHDVWGLTLKKADPLYGKKFAMEMMSLDKTYQSFDRNGWHFIFLDSTHQRENGIWYTAKLDEEQFEWLADDLKNTDANKPVFIVSHIPVLTASVFLDDYRQRFGKFQIPGTWMHTDVKKIMGLFNQYQNIKICVSGHIHLYDEVRYNNISFYCNGAVSGDWWKNRAYHETQAGYAVIDLYDDGSFENRYIHYLA